MKIGWSWILKADSAVIIYSVWYYANAVIKVNFLSWSFEQDKGQFLR